MKIVQMFAKSISFFVMLAISSAGNAQEFQGKAFYSSKTTMDMSQWGGNQMSEQQKKEIEARMKNWLEKNYVLTFNKQESIYVEEEKLDAPGGGRGNNMWGSSFSTGPVYKDIKSKTFIQDQEFFGKQFLIKEEMTSFEWKMSSESKQIGQYLAYKATTIRPASDVDFSISNRRGRGNRQNETEKSTDSAALKEIATEESEEEMIEVVAWFTPQIPIGQGPGDYWGLPGLILEVNAGNTVMLCKKIVMNPDVIEKIDAPKKGEEVTKKEYREIITEKMEEMRNNRGRGNNRSRN